jgi:hypothetical protein
MSVGSVQMGRLETFAGGVGRAFDGAGFVTLSDGGHLDVAGDVRMDTGALILENGSITATTLFVRGEILVVEAPPVVSGSGLINADVVNSGGFIRPGQSAGILNVNGDFTQLVGGTTQIELGGLTQGVDYDFLDISGVADLDGLLEVSLIDSFGLSSGEFFDVMTASSINLGGLSLSGEAGLGMEIIAGGNGQVLRLSVLAVPEPAIGSLFLFGMLGVGLIRRRRRLR